MRKSSVIGYICILVIVFGLGAWVGISINGNGNEATILPQDSASEFQLVAQAWTLTRENYVDTTATQPQNLAYGTIEGMMNSLGDTGHSTFLTPDQVKQENDFSQGRIEGIGIEVQQKNGEIVIVAPMDNSPAQKAGLHTGDIILKVDGQSVKNIQDTALRIRGPSGTTVTLTIQTTAGATREVKLVRSRINLESVTWRQLPGTNVVHLQIASFTKGTTGELDAALVSIKTQNASGIILDLRDNPGGLLDEAVGVASRFLKSGDVLLAKDSVGNITHIPVIPNNAVTDLPVVTLINQRTASASEIVAGALHDAERTKLVGETTFGTGTVLEQFSLQDGSALLLAIQEWLTPSGKTIWHVGLAPDIAVTLAANVSPLFPTSEQGLTSEQLQNNSDQQLLRAASLLSLNKPNR
jgi:carboxyl-terminal processing protease